MATRKEVAPPVAHGHEVTFEQVLERLAANGRPYDPDFLDTVYRFSAASHGEQTRRSGEPYMTHPLHVAFLLADWKFDQTCVAIGLLHDVLEDTLTTREALEQNFGGELAELVDGVTKIGTPTCGAIRPRPRPSAR
jgi:GTP pyrophosphokinase